MVKDFKVTGPELVSFEGPVAALELLPDPESASPWANIDMKVTDADSKTLGTHLGRSRLLARGSKGITIEVQMGELLRMLFRTPDSEGEDGRVDFLPRTSAPTRSVKCWSSAISSPNFVADPRSTSA